MLFPCFLLSLSPARFLPSEQAPNAIHGSCIYSSSSSSTSSSSQRDQEIPTFFYSYFYFPTPQKECVRDVKLLASPRSPSPPLSRQRTRRTVFQPTRPSARPPCKMHFFPLPSLCVCMCLSGVCVCSCASRAKTMGVGTPPVLSPNKCLCVCE